MIFLRERVGHVRRGIEGLAVRVALVLENKVLAAGESGGILKKEKAKILCMVSRARRIPDNENRLAGSMFLNTFCMQPPTRAVSVSRGERGVAIKE